MSTLPKIPSTHLDIVEQELMAMVSTLRHQDGRISTNPVTFDWDGEYLRFSTLKQRVKYKNLLANPQITLCIMCLKNPTRYIEVRGHAELTDDPGGKFQLSLWKKYTGLDEFNLDPPGSERVTVKIIPEKISAPDLYGGRLDSYST